MLTEPVRVLDHVPEVLATVGAEKRIVMITKGDLVHQTRKVTTSGLEHHFSDIEILLEKDSVAYAKIFRRLGVEPERVLMVGNSVKSDILPVLALGGHAVHIPYRMTWELERVDEHDEEFAELASMGELPGWLGIQSRRSCTRSTRWSAVLCKISDARSRVGAMFSARLRPLISRQIPLAVATASSSLSSA
jgi:putative hydrolase of the HAD superfamily